MSTYFRHIVHVRTFTITRKLITLHGLHFHATALLASTWWCGIIANSKLLCDPSTTFHWAVSNIPVWPPTIHYRALTVRKCSSFIHTYILTWTTVKIAGDICNIVTLTIIATTAGVGIGACATLGYHTATTSGRTVRFILPFTPPTIHYYRNTTRI